MKKAKTELIEELDFLQGMDDLAHNRLHSSQYRGRKVVWVKVKNYGVRNHKYKCYCTTIKRLQGRKTS